MCPRINNSKWTPLDKDTKQQFDVRAPSVQILGKKERNVQRGCIYSGRHFSSVSRGTRTGLLYLME